MAILLILCVLSDTGLGDGSIPRARGVLQYVRVCMRMSLSVIRCNNSHLHLQRVGIKRST